jgi:PAS domain S-box-containing protein
MSESHREEVRHYGLELRLRVLVFLLAFPAAFFGIWSIWNLRLGMSMRMALSCALVLLLLMLGRALLKAVNTPLGALAAIVEAYRDGDYTLRSSRASQGDSLGDLAFEISALGDTLSRQRLKSMEATALLDKLIGDIDVAVMAFDGEGQLRLLNLAATRLLGMTAENAINKSASDLGIHELLQEGSDKTRTVTAIAGQTGRWQVTHGTFRQDGLAQHLLIVADVRQVLREEERSAWQRLLRVISHEINNSLAPIKSLAETLADMLAKSLPRGALRDDTLPALQVIGERTNALQRFLAQHSKLARLPVPQRRWVPARPLLMRVASLEQAHGIQVQAPDDLEMRIDTDQIEQILINLVKNSIEAQRESPRPILIGARDDGDRLIITVVDEGPGIANPDNLFVPFFTTKPGGSGIGLTLSRQIAEAHGGSLLLENREERKGAIATVSIPGGARRS